MTLRRRRETRFIVIITLTVIFLVFAIYHYTSNSNSLWKDDFGFNDRNFLYKNATVSVLKKIITHSRSEAFVGEKLVHLDLKGAPPRVSYFKEFFPFIKNLGATGVVIEYEDMFYYKDELEDIRALNAYKPSAINTIRELAANNNLIVIPLIQTFGHFEFVLKLEYYKDLREVSNYPQAVCPSHVRALTVIKKMIDQVLEAHPESRYIHIGCDEVMYLGECDKCKTVMTENEWSTVDLFLNHVKNVALYINTTYPGVRPIMWGDMIARISDKLLKKSGISSLVDLMVWKYVPNVSQYITNDLLRTYAEVFKTIWIASAFKGATEPNQKITDVQYHLQNHVAWMKIVSEWKNSINFKGILLTGWQRYDHFAETCELLPVSIPSLAVCLNYLNGSEKDTKYSDVLKALQCDSSFSFSPFAYEYSRNVERCNFPGFNVYRDVNRFYVYSKKINNHFSVINSGWFSFYHVLHKFSSPSHVKDIFDKWLVNDHLMEVKELEQDLKKSLSEVYDMYTVKEWITSYVTPIRIRLEAIINAKEAILAQTAWPRRPFLDNDEVGKAAEEICTSGRKFGCALLLT